MYLIGDQPPYAEKLINTLQSSPQQLLEDLGRELWTEFEKSAARAARKAAK